MTGGSFELEPLGAGDGEEPLPAAPPLPAPEGDGADSVESRETVIAAIKTILVADLVMSIDNVIAVAGAAHGSIGLLIFGLAVSIPLIVWSSQLVLKLMDRFPFIVTCGAALLGWVAGSMIATDATLRPWLEAYVPHAEKLFAIAGAVLVVAVGFAIARRASRRQALKELIIDAGEKL